MDVIQASIPLFFVMIGLELLVAWRTGRRLYRLNDSISDLSLGTVSQLIGIFMAVGTVFLYGAVERNWSIQRLLDFPRWSPGAPAAWAVVFVLDDLAYYWLHRLSHEVNILWAGHVVHHSSEEYNLTVALRQSSLHGLMSWVFYLPLALLGIPAAMWVVCHGVNLIYQFWIHTRAIGRLPRGVEAVMNTPSHHRVHHGVNPQYQDRNYAGVFIIWDRLFGSFEPETEPPVYGITKPLASWNPVWANVHVFVDIARKVRRAATWRDRLRVVFGRPGWSPTESGPAERPGPVMSADYRKFDPAVPRPLLVYAAGQFVVVVIASVALLSAASSLPVVQVLAGVFYLTLALCNVAAVLESRPWVTISEPARLLALAAATGILLAQGRGPTPLLIAGTVFALVSTGWFVLGTRHSALGARLRGS